MGHPVLYHPDYTVGPGITPDLLTLPSDPADCRMRAWKALAGWTSCCSKHRYQHPSSPPVGNRTPPRERLLQDQNAVSYTAPPLQSEVVNLSRLENRCRLHPISSTPYVVLLQGYFLTQYYPAHQVVTHLCRVTFAPHHRAKLQPISACASSDVFLFLRLRSSWPHFPAWL